MTVIDTGGRPGATEAGIARWWKEPDPGPAMVAAAKRIEESPQERSRRAACLIFARLHSGRPLSSIYDYGSAFRTAYVADPWGFGWRLPLNVVQAVIEAISAKLAKNKPRALILTEGGNYTLQRQAKGLTKYLDGLHRTNQLYKKGRRVYKDSGTFGTGIFDLYEDHKRGLIGVDRTLSVEMIIDEQEAARGEPQTVYKKTPVYRGVLLDLYPKKRDIIEDAKGYNPAGFADGRMSDMVPVYQGWHLNGSHVVGIDEGTLDENDWPFPWFPQVHFNWREPLSGIWGQGAAENLLGIQREISKMLGKFSRNMSLGAKLWIFRQPGGGLSKAQLTNEDMTVIDAEQPPTFATPPVMPDQAYRYLWELYSKAFEIEGVSELSASGKKPAGLDAAVAIREFNDVETERFVLQGQDWEDCHMEIAEKEIALSKRMYKSKAIVVKAPGTKFIESIDFAEVDMDENSFDIGKFPTSSLPTTPAARMQRIQELYESGLVPDRETALSLLDFPDLQEALSLQLSAIDDIKRCIENMVEKGKPEVPEPYTNLELALRMVQSAYLRARNDGVPEKNRELLLRFIGETKELLDELHPPPAAAGAPGMPNTPAVGPPMPAEQALPPGTQMPLPQGMDSAAVPSQLPA